MSGVCISLLADLPGRFLECAEHSVERIEELVRQVQALDMDAVRAAIEEEKRAEVALRMRRVCPTARRRG